jgi:hypothetical protein
MINTKVLPAVAIVLLSLTMAATATGNYILLKDILATAGGRASSDSYLLGYSVGQTAVGYCQGHSHVEWAGFWGGLPWGPATFVPQQTPQIGPQKYMLHQNYPNPFNPQTHISYQLSQAGQVSLCIYNIKGQLVKRLLDQYQQSGEHSITWDGRDAYGIPVASGVYFYRLSAGRFQEVRKMLLLK